MLGLRHYGIKCHVQQQSGGIVSGGVWAATASWGLALGHDFLPTDATLSFRPTRTCHFDRREKSWYRSPSRFLPLVGMTMPCSVPHHSVATNEPVIPTETNLSFRPKGEILLEGIWLLANIKISPFGRNDRDGCPGCLTTPCEKERAPGRNARRQFMASPCRVTLRSCPRRGNPTYMTWIG